MFVNRVWQSYFGTGLVSTSEDLGTQGETPSHPELLDWLACEFMDRGWSMKALHRLIVGSAAYRQSSRVTPGLHARDPENRLLARGPRFRVEAEIVRDIALASSGLLNPKLGGASIYAPAPGFLFLPPRVMPPSPGRKRPAPTVTAVPSTPSAGGQRPTRCSRHSTHPTATPRASAARVRIRPLQALTTLNETVFVECARALARKVLEHGGRTDRERVAYAFRRVLARTPTDDERKILLGLLETESETYRRGPGERHANWPTARARSPTRPAGVSPAQLAAYTVVSRVLLNLDETITKD